MGLIMKNTLAAKYSWFGNFKSMTAAVLAGCNELAK